MVGKFILADVLVYGTLAFKKNIKVARVSMLRA
jgi:hypothetical protein